MLSEMGHGVCTDSCHSIDQVASGSLMPGPGGQRRTLEVKV